MVVSNKTHQYIRLELEKLAKIQPQKLSSWLQHYLGSDKPTLCLKMSVVHALAKKTAKELNSPKDLYDLIDSLYEKGHFFEEYVIAAIVFGNSKLRDNFDLRHLDHWLSYTNGWAQIDSLCQSNFSAAEVLDGWHKWQPFLHKLSGDKNISKRRASLVLLCKSLRQSDDRRLFNLGIELVEKLKWEKEILITKAVSWILRSMVKNFPDEVGVYLEANKLSLPSIAYRETTKKLTTGRKN